MAEFSGAFAVEGRVQTELPPDPSLVPPSGSNLATTPTSAPSGFAPPVAEAPVLSDRSTLLVLFGVAQILLGLMAALMVPFTALGMFMSRLGPRVGTMRPGQFISGMAVYAFAAVVFFCLGIGSIQAKRWARALTLVTSWYWLLSGALITVLMTAVLPVMVRQILHAQQQMSGAPSSQVPTGVMAVILTVIIVFAAFFLIAVPIAFIVFYSRKDVADTCRRRDPMVRWTDRTPLPVLGASVVLAGQALYLLLAGIGTPLFPFFGRYLYGIPAFGCFLLVAALDAYLAVALFHLKPTGWWIAMITGPVRMLSMVLTYMRADLTDAYSRMGLSQKQLELLNSNPIVHSHVILWWSLFSMVILYGYLVWLKRYFKPPEMQPRTLSAAMG